MIRRGEFHRKMLGKIRLAYMDRMIRLRAGRSGGQENRNFLDEIRTMILRDLAYGHIRTLAPN